MTDQTRDEINRYARLGPEARALVDDYDVIDLAEMLVAAKNDIASCKAQQWPQRLARAELELRRYTEAESADAAAGSYAGRAEAAEAFIAFVADTIADHEGDEWADHSATRAIRAAITRAVEPPGPAATQATDGPIVAS